MWLITATSLVCWNIFSSYCISWTRGKYSERGVTGWAKSVLCFPCFPLQSDKVKEGTPGMFPPWGLWSCSPAGPQGLGQGAGPVGWVKVEEEAGFVTFILDSTVGLTQSSGTSSNSFIVLWLLSETQRVRQTKTRVKYSSWRKMCWSKGWPMRTLGFSKCPSWSSVGGVGTFRALSGPMWGLSEVSKGLCCISLFSASCWHKKNVF